jgi:hypothetical protein
MTYSGSYSILTLIHVWKKRILIMLEQGRSLKYSSNNARSSSSTCHTLQRGACLPFEKSVGLDILWIQCRYMRKEAISIPQVCLALVREMLLFCWYAPGENFVQDRRPVQSDSTHTFPEICFGLIKRLGSPKQINPFVLRQVKFQDKIIQLTTHLYA